MARAVRLGPDDIAGADTAHYWRNRARTQYNGFVDARGPLRSSQIKGRLLMGGRIDGWVAVGPMEVWLEGAARDEVVAYLTRVQHFARMLREDASFDLASFNGGYDDLPERIVAALDDEFYEEDFELLGGTRLPAVCEYVRGTDPADLLDACVTWWNTLYGSDVKGIQDPYDTGRKIVFAGSHVDGVRPTGDGFLMLDMIFATGLWHWLGIQTACSLT